MAAYADVVVVVSLAASFSVVGWVLGLVEVQELMFGLGLSGAETVQEAPGHQVLQLYRKDISAHEMSSPAMYGNLLRVGIYEKAKRQKVDAQEVALALKTMM